MSIDDTESDLENFNHKKSCKISQQHRQMKYRDVISIGLHKLATFKYRKAANNINPNNKACEGGYVESEISSRISEKKCKKAFLELNYKYKRRSINGKQNGESEKEKHNNHLVLSDNNYCYLSICFVIVNAICSEMFNYIGELQKQASRCVKMIRIYRLSFVLLLTAVIVLSQMDTTEAGACWMAQIENGKCKELYSKNMSKEECCSGGQHEFAYTEKDMSDVEYFFAAALGEGANCIPCLASV